MRSDRRIDPAGDFALIKDHIVQLLSHAKQALEFEILTLARQLLDGGDAVRIMGGKLGIETVRL